MSKSDNVSSTWNTHGKIYITHPSFKKTGPFFINAGSMQHTEIVTKQSTKETV